MFGNKNFIIKLKYPVSHYLICLNKKIITEANFFNDLFHFNYCFFEHTLIFIANLSGRTHIFLSVDKLLNTFNFSLLKFFFFYSSSAFIKLNENKKKKIVLQIFVVFSIVGHFVCILFLFFGNNRNENESTYSFFFIY